VYVGDSQQDSLPTPQGDFELTGFAYAQDTEYLYIALQGNPKLLNGVLYKNKLVGLGDLFLGTQAVRLTEANASNIPLGTIVTPLTWSNVSKDNFGQNTLADYENRLTKLNFTAYNPNAPIHIQSGQSLVSTSTNELGGVSYLTAQDIGLPSYFGENITVVKIPLAHIKTDNDRLDLALTLECINDVLTGTIILNTDIPIDVVTIDSTIPSYSFEGVEEIDNNIEYILGGAAVVLLTLLLLGSDGTTVSLQPPVVNLPNPEVPIVTPPNVVDVLEPTSTFVFVFILFLSRICLTNKKRVS
jgi:hypothetical protein